MKRKVLIILNNAEIKETLTNNCTSSNISFLLVEDGQVNEFDILNKMNNYISAYFIIDSFSNNYKNLKRIMTLAKVKKLNKIGFIVKDKVESDKKGFKDIIEYMDTTILTNSLELGEGVNGILSLSVNNTLTDMFNGNLVGYLATSKGSGENKLDHVIKDVFVKYFTKSNGLLPKKISLTIELSKDLKEDYSIRLVEELKKRFSNENREITFNCIEGNKEGDSLSLFMLGVI